MRHSSIAGRVRGLSLVAAGVCTVLAGLAAGQPVGTSPLNPPANGPRRADTSWNALTNATVHVKPGTTLEHATVVIRDGRIVSVSGGAPEDKGPQAPAAPPGARVWDCKGLHIYPGFIDAYVEVEAPAPDPSTPGVHWNARVMPQRSALDGAGIDESTAGALRKMGFAAAAISPKGGIFRGKSAVVSLAKPVSDASVDRPPVYSQNAYHTIAFETGGRRIGGGGGDQGPDVVRWSQYPDSEMGAIALIRQTLIDQEWQEEARKAGAPLAFNALDALNPEWARNAPTNTVANAKIGDPGGAVPMPLVFDTEDELEALRAAKIAREFKRSAVLLGSGYEFRRLDAIKADGLPIILPLRFPKAPDVAGVGKADAVDLRELMTWEQAPTNPKRLDAAGVKVALTTSKLRSRGDFSEALGKALKHGLPPERALAMLTTQPAELLGISDRLGTIEVGKAADLVVADGDLFDPWPKGEKDKEAKKEDGKKGDEAPKAEEKPGDLTSGREMQPAGRGRGGRGGPGGSGGPGGPSGGPGGEGRGGSKGAKIRDVWIDGQRHEITPAPTKDAVGTWAVINVDGAEVDPGAADAVMFVVTADNSITYRRSGKEEKASNVRVQGLRVEYTIDGKKLFDIDSVLMDQGVVEGDQMIGITPMPNGKIHRWTAKRIGGPEAFKPKEGEKKEGDKKDAKGEEKEEKPAGLIGKYVVNVEGDSGRQPAEPQPTIDIKSETAITVDVHGGPVEAKNIVVKGDQVEFTVDAATIGQEGVVAVRATREGDTLRGTAQSPDGEKHEFTAERAKAEQPKKEGAGQPGDKPGEGRGRRGGEPAKDPEQEEKEAIASIPEKLGYPFGPYMLTEQPEQPELLRIINATIWTEGPQGVIENGEIVVEKGKITYVGPTRLEFTSSAHPVTVDARGKHVSPGIIDCHSHTGISKGVNESGQAVTAEVRIQDVTDPDSISWYRQLGGGVTTVNSLHGSANAIGGQNCVNKVRWGVERPDQMHFEGAMPGIKFALGENPKQSNWGDRSNVRYPQSRMGVEALIRDRFTAAKQYLEQWNQYLSRSTTAETLDAMDRVRQEAAAARGEKIAPAKPLSASAEPVGIMPRRDLELDALAEVLVGKRLIHCHSYRQDEVLMLCRIADDFGFKLGTFQHILEGYKVADEVAKHSLGGSCFSDWWAYKVEVQDAIPQGGPIMAEQGVTVSFNSDSDELARRLNWEAGKAVKYGQDVKPEDALKFVTINPARQLMIDGRVGSLEVGKDADLAIWSGPPMSSLSRCEATYVDGRRLFSLGDDAKHRETIQKERSRLIQKALAAAKSGRGGGEETGGGGRGMRPGDDDRGGMLRRYYLDQINRGRDPAAATPGECGCGEVHE